VLDEVFARLAQDFDGLRLDLQHTLACGDSVVVQGRYRAERDRATGRPLDAQFVHVWDLREGQVVGFQQYTDTQQWNDVLTSG
jgi:ketosteroid isomerase-like protein